MLRISFTLQSIFGTLAILALSASSYAQSRVVAYVPNWIDLTSFSETIDYAKLTHINIAFENPANEDGDLSFNKKDEALITKARNHHEIGRAHV